MKELALKAVAELSKRHNPEFVILYGSIPRGDYNEASDIDVACFCDIPDAINDTQEFEGRRLDSWLYSTLDVDSERDEFLRFVGGQVFHDRNGSGQRFLDEIEKRYKAGPAPLGKEAIHHMEEWSKNMLERSKGSDIEARFRRTWLPCELLEIYFQLRNMWYQGSKQSFKWLSAHDPAAYQAFSECFSEPTSIEKLDTLVKITLRKS